MRIVTTPGLKARNPFLVRLALVACAAGLLARPVAAQQANGPSQNLHNANDVSGGMGPNSGARAERPTAAYGGAANADFDSLIDLIQSTVENSSWADTGGGTGEIRPFPTGVMVDAAGTLQLVKATAPTADLAQQRGTAPPAKSLDDVAGLSSSDAPHVVRDDPHRASKLRYISLPRLEREIISRQDAHKPLDPTMLALAGLQRVRYVFVYPESGDLVLAGPAGDWRISPFGRVVSTETGEPIVRLDDLLVLLRRAQQSPESFFGCAINPRQEALAKTQEFLNRSSARPLEPRQRDAWLRKLRETLGRQDIDIFGIDPASRVARVLVEADVHMKLVGMGLADGVDGVESYLDTVAAGGGQPIAMSVLRWWFALNYAAVRTSPDGNAYELVGQGVRVLSENEMLAAQGRRVHTGQSDPLNQKFADSFTAQFDALAKKYPVYGDLRNIFDVALAVALIHADHLMDRAGWKPTRLADAERLRLPRWQVPREVDTVANYVEVNRRQLIAGVSGGVMVATADVLAKPREAAPGGGLDAAHKTPPAAEDATVWWWDAAQTAR